jgi:hypothetical protein
MDLEVSRPVNDNSATLAKRAGGKASKSHKEKSHKGGMDVPNEHKPSHSPQAVSLPGALPVLMEPGRGGHRMGAIVGVPGIINSTVTSPETRQRLVSGILDLCEARGAKGDGPVHTVSGHDSTAYNSGMVHLAGSRF